MRNKLAVKFPLWIVLNVPFATILLISAVLIAWLGIQNGTSAVNDLASQLLIDKTIRVEQQLDSYLMTPFIINNMNLDVLRFELLDMEEPQPVERLFVAETMRFDTVAAITFANENREYVGTARDILGVDLVIAASSEQTEFTLEAYETNAQGERGQLVNNPSEYDPRPRPWYQAAVTAGQSTWTPIFIWSKQRGIGLDAVTPVYDSNGDLEGVLDVSLYLSGISEFLQESLVTDETTVFIVDEAGFLVASSKIAQPYMEVNGELERIEVLSSTNPLLQFTTQKIIGQFGMWSSIENSQQFHFTLAGERHLVHVVPYQNTGLQWWIVAVVPEKAYLASIQAHSRFTILLIILSLTGSVILMSLVSHGITRPILQMSQASRDIAAGNWSVRMEVNRRDELGELAASFNQMADQLHDSTLSLKASEARLRAIFENSAEAIVVSSQGSQVTNNPAFMKIFGYVNPDDLTGQSILKFIAPGERERISEYIRRRSQGEAIPDSYETRGYRQDGSEFDLEVRVSTYWQNNELYAIAILRDITERKQYETKLKEAERFARSTVDALSAHIAIIDENSTVLSVNAAWSQFSAQNLGCLNSATIGMNYLHYLETVGNSTSKAVIPGIQQLLNGKIDTFSIEYPCYTSNEELWFIFRMTRFSGEGTIRIVVALENITAQVLSAQHLAEQKYQLNERVKEINCLYNHAKLVEQPGISIEALCQGTVDLMHPAWQYPDITCVRLITESREYITGNFKETRWSQSSNIFVGQKYFGTLAVYYLEEKPDAVEGPFLHEERLLLDELARCVGQKIEGLEAEAALQKAYDTLEERVIYRTAQLQTAKEHVEAILNSSVDGILLTDTHFTIQRTNAAFDQLFACSQNDYIDQHLGDLLFIEADNLTINEIERRVATEENLYKEIRARRRDDTIFDAEISIGHIRDEGLVCVIRDITQRKQAEAALWNALAKEKELGELKTRFISMASHEFRTPLATILATTETLSAYRHKFSENQIEERLDKIKEYVDHLKDIMEDVLMLAQMQSRRVKFNPVSVDLDSLCRSVIDEFKSREDVGQRIEYKCNGEIRELLLDQKLMRQIISNLVSNAVKYSPQGMIHIRLEYQEIEVRLEIADEGIGIPEADIPHLFEPFHRAANVEAISGTGLGLVITKESVELHNGKITVASQPNAGTTFIVCIPIEKVITHDENSGN